MDLVVFGAMLASAFLHAVWNAWVKSRRDSNAAIAALVIGAGIPNIAVIAALGWPAAPAPVASSGRPPPTSAGR